MVSPFYTEGDIVMWVTGCGAMPLDHGAREALLVFLADRDDLTSARLFNSLHDKHVQAGGIPRAPAHLTMKALPVRWVAVPDEVAR